MKIEKTTPPAKIPRELPRKDEEGVELQEVEKKPKPDTDLPVDVVKISEEALELLRKREKKE